EGSALQAAPSRDATPLLSVHPRAGGDGAADLSPLGGTARSAKGAPGSTYAQRLKAYMTKACREAKLHTSWTGPDEAYEDAVHRLIDLVLGDDELAARI